jgi:hypothetical protein
LIAVRKLPKVEDAKELMNEAMEWSVFKWLFEKRRVRETADEANAALDKLNHEVKSRWNREIGAAYESLSKRNRPAAQNADNIDPEIMLFVAKVKEADKAAQRARLKAENTFDEAERTLSTDLAREGCRQAISSWELHEKAIRIAESGLVAKQS